MKQLTIKKKITLWYTGIIAVVLGTILVLVLLFVDKVGISATEEEIIAAVTGFSSNINFQDDSFYLDGDTEFYDDGIMFCIYDKNGRLLYGTIPTQFPEETILKSNTPRMITGSNRKWMIYDSVYTYGDDEEMWVRGITSVHSIELFMQTSEKMLLIVFPLLIILIGAIGYFMIKRALRQVDLICDEVENISNGKDLSKRLSLPKAKDELYELSEKFNEMFERLEFSFEKERQFTSDVSHELRTPVAVIISQCEYLLENENLSAEDKEEIAVILKQAKRMSKLTSEMLMIARNEQGEQHLMEKLDFGLLSELVIEELQTKAQEKNIEITLQKQDDLFMNGDQTLILRMMMNLITNAINYGSLAKANVDDRMKIIELGESLDAPVRIDTYMYPSVRERNHAYNNQARLDPEMAAKARVEVLQREMGEEVFAQYRKIQLDEAENTPEGEAVPGQMACRAGKSSFVVNWQGEMRSCVVLDKPSIPLRDVEFEEAWKFTKKETESLRISARCSSCKLRKVCNTCVAAAIAETGKADGVPEYLCRYTEATVRYLKETSKK